MSQMTDSQAEHGRIVPIAPWERFALVGKTGCGKTTTGTALACSLVPPTRREAKGWEIWWLDSKGDMKDIARLFSWGFVPSGARTDSARRIFFLREKEKMVKGRLELDGPTIHEQMERVCSAALRRHGVLLVVDEYSHVVKNRQDAGRELLNVFQRGRGLDVGLLGFTQEPVFIPRQLISQASHIFLHDISYPLDQERAREYLPEYVRPSKAYGHKHGFFHGAIDFDGDWTYWSNIQAWLDGHVSTS
jgi:energy-coupling factor transporter ATP-binding protein EcfA2